MSDLFGSDLPVPDTDSGEQTGQRTEGSGGTSARFSWCDGVFLSALKAGKWVLLDELNLATQVRCFFYGILKIRHTCISLYSKRSYRGRSVCSVFTSTVRFIP